MRNNNMKIRELYEICKQLVEEGKGGERVRASTMYVGDRESRIQNGAEIFAYYDDSQLTIVFKELEHESFEDIERYALEADVEVDELDIILRDATDILEKLSSKIANIKNRVLV